MFRDLYQKFIFYKSFGCFFEGLFRSLLFFSKLKKHNCITFEYYHCFVFALFFLVIWWRSNLHEVVSRDHCRECTLYMYITCFPQHIPFCCRHTQTVCEWHIFIYHFSLSLYCTMYIHCMCAYYTVIRTNRMERSFHEMKTKRCMRKRGTEWINKVTSCTKCHLSQNTR